MATTTQTIRVEIDDSQAQRALGGLSRAIAAIGGINFVSNLAQQFVQLANSATEMQNKLIFATGSVENADKAFAILADSARRTGSNLGGTVDLFQKLAMSTTFAGSSTESLAFITEQFNKTLQISGTSGAGAAAALYQFAQAMQKGTVNGDEFRTMQETNGFIMKVLEQQTGKTRTELIAMASDGRLSAEMVGRALAETTLIAENYGKITQTLPQAQENFRTSLTEAVKEMDRALGITAALANALNFLAKNSGAVVGALAGIVVAIVALTAALIPAATAMTILTGGLALLAAAGVGAAIGAAVQQANKLKNGVDNTTKSQQQLNEEARKGLKITQQQTQQQIDLNKNLVATISQLRATNVIESQNTGLRNISLEVEKELVKEREKYKKIGATIPPQLERELATELRKKILLEETNSTKRKFLELQSAIVVSSTQDASQRQVLNQLEQFRLSVTKETYDAYKNQYQTLIQQNIQAQALVEFTNRLKESQIEVTNLNIRDLDLREQQIAVDRERLRLGSLFTSEMEAQVRATVRNQQAVKELMATEEQRLLLQGAARNVSRVEQIGIATGAIGRLDPRLAAEQQFQTEMEALRNTEFQNETQRMMMLERLRREHANRLHEISKQQAEADLRAAGVTNQGVLEAVRKSQDNIRLMQQGGVQAAIGTVDQMSQIFGQLGTYSKRAFEAAKGFNIASAIMNTYLGATKALAMYPPPFNFIAAAAVVASGLAQVAAIRSQSYSGRQLGGPVMANTPYIVGENGPELFVPPNTGSIVRNGDLRGGEPVNVTFNIMANDTSGFDDLLLSRRGLIRSVISDAMLESGRRG